MKDTAMQVTQAERKFSIYLGLRSEGICPPVQHTAVILIAVAVYYYPLHLFAHGDPKDHVTVTMVLESDPDDTETINPEKVISVCSKALTEEAKTDDRLLVRIYECRARAYLAVKRFESAKSDYEKILKVKPGDSNTRCQYAHVLATLGRKREANQEVARVIKSSPRHVLANAMAAESCLLDKNLDACVKHATIAIEVNDALPIPYYTRAIAYMLQGSLQYSLKDISRYIELQPLSFNSNNNTDGSPYLLRASLFILLDKPKRALRDLAMARCHGADSFSILHETCSAYYNMKKYQIACYLAKKMIDLDEKKPQGYWAYAAALAKLGRLQEALKVAKSVQSLDPKNGRTYYQLGSICVFLDDYGDAIKYYEESVKRSSNRIDAWKAQILIYAACQDEKHRDGVKARKLASELFHKTGEDDPESHLLMSIVYAESGDFSKALDSLEKALFLAKANSPVQRICEKCKSQFQDHKPFRISIKDKDDLFFPVPR